MRHPLRILFALAISLLSLPAWADWNYCRLADNRLVILDEGQRFVLKRGASWTLADNTQKTAYEKWRTANSLPADPAEAIQALPQSKSLPLSGRLELTIDGDEYKTVRFTIGTKAYAIKLGIAADDEWMPEIPDAAKVKDVATALKVDKSTLLVKLAQKTGLLEQAAWGKVIVRLRTGREFFTVTPAGVLWANPSAPSDPVPNTSTTGGSEPPKSDVSDKEPKDKADGIPLWLLIGIPTLTLAIGGAIGYWLAAARSTPTVTKTGSREGKLGALSHHEEQLIRKVRDESRTKGDDEQVVGKMMESYGACDNLRAELSGAQAKLQELDQYRQYSEQFKEFDGQAKKLKQTATDTEAHLNTARRELETQRNRVSSLQSELNAANNRVGGLSTELESCYKLFDDFEKWQKSLEARLQKIMDQESPDGPRTK